MNGSNSQLPESWIFRQYSLWIQGINMQIINNSNNNNAPSETNKMFKKKKWKQLKSNPSEINNKGTKNMCEYYGK